MQVAERIAANLRPTGVGVVLEAEHTVPELRFPAPPLTEGAVVLRPWTPDDVPFVVQACQDPLISRNSPNIPFPYAEADAVGWFKSHEPNRLAGRALNLAVVHAETGNQLGAIRIGELDMTQLTASIGYWLAPEARGHGYMTSATRALARWAIDELGIARLELTTEPGNVASQRVAERCGFRLEGRLRSHMLIQRSGERRDSLLYSLLPGELTDD
jgi:[ribosomal protein S5]-alanine N-acetyltransferase